MQSNQLKTESATTKEFPRSLDFYWQFIAAYAIALIVYGLFRGTIDEGRLSIVLADPIVILLFLFIMGSGITLLVNLYKKQSIIIGRDFITFKNRFREKSYSSHEIVKISLHLEKITRFRGRYRVIKIQTTNRTRNIRIRPSSFANESELISTVTHLKKHINK